MDYSNANYAEMPNSELELRLIGLDDDDVIEAIENELYSRPENDIDAELDRKAEAHFKASLKAPKSALRHLLANEHNMEVKEIVEFMTMYGITPEQAGLEPMDEIVCRYNTVVEHGYTAFEDVNFGKGSTAGQRD